MINEKFVLIAAVFNIVGSSSYVISTLRGKAKPNRVTWALWALAPLIAFSAQIDEGVGIRSLMTFMVGFGPLLVFVASFVNRKAYWKITKLDVACGIVSILALVLWKITGTGIIAIVFSIAADLMAGVPTIIKSYKEPETEHPTVFLLGGISAIITLLTIEHWTFASYGFALYILSICTLLFTLIAFPKFRLAHTKRS